MLDLALVGKRRACLNVHDFYSDLTVFSTVAYYRTASRTTTVFVCLSQRAIFLKHLLKLMQLTADLYYICCFLLSQKNSRNKKFKL